MTYRSILVHLDDSPRCPARITLAAAIAKAQGAHLLGLAPTGLVDLPADLQPTSMDGVPTLAAARKRLQEAAEECVQRFNAQVAPLGLVSHEGRVHGDDTLSAVLQHARWCDLVVLGQHDPSHHTPLVPWDLPQQVFLQAGRPVLVVPYAGDFKTVGRKVVVSWKDTREAARALTDALPLLQQAQEVHVLGFASPAEATGATRALEALAPWLSRQGVQAQLHAEVTELDVGEALLSRAFDLGADLIVMGGYGHSRVTELVMGGVTRSLLAEMTVPLLVSH
ncbi:MAG: universal stress protein [Rhizobacter sp.]|nr:universal stress protein [Rhizobacter sp.]